MFAGAALVHAASKPNLTVPQIAQPKHKLVLPADLDAGAFEPAPRCDKPRPGFVFKNGKQGLGFYEDLAAAAAAAAAAASAAADATETP